MASPQREVREWESGKKHFDLSQQFAQENKELCSNFGRDKLSYRPELYQLNAVYWAKNEAR